MNPMRDILSWTNGRIVLLGRRQVRPDRPDGFLRCNSSLGTAWYGKIAAILSNTWVQGAPLLSPTCVEKGSKNSCSGLGKTLCFGKLQACRQHTSPQWRQISRACETRLRQGHHPVRFEGSFEDRWALRGFRCASTLTSHDTKERPDWSHQRQTTASSHDILAARDLEDQVSEEQSLEEETRLPDLRGGGRSHATIATAGKKVSAEVFRAAAAAVLGTQSEAAVLSRVAEKNIELLMFMGGSVPQVTRFFTWFPDLHHQSARPMLLKSVSLFKEFGIDSKQLLEIEERLNRDRKRSPHLLFGRHPQIRETLEYLRGSLGNGRAGVAGVAKMIVRYPAFLNYSVAKLEENKRNLESLNLDIKFLEKYPALLAYKPETLRLRVTALQEALGPQMGSASLHPMKLFINAESIGPRIQNVKNLFGDTVGVMLINRQPTLLIAKEATVTKMYEELTKTVGREIAESMIVCHPSLLSSAWNTIEKKIQYFTEELGRESEEWVRNPVLLAFSLEKRIKPRLAALTRAGGHIIYSLTSILTLSDARFEEKFGVTLPPRPRMVRWRNKVAES